MEDRRPVWARPRLCPDRLVLTRWAPWACYRRRIPFDRLAAVEHEDQHLILHQEDADAVRLRMEDAAQWRAALDLHRTVYERSE